MTVDVHDGVATVTLDRFDADAYELFLRCKALPESDIVYDWRADAYTVTTAARYAGQLGAEAVERRVAERHLASHLFDYQRWIVRRALDARRFAVWIDTGLGKTAIQLEWARQVVEHGPVLIFAPLQVVTQTISEATSFYGDELAVKQLRTGAELTAWLDAPEGVAITNTEKLARGELPLRRLTGVVLDESSILKTGGGTIKWNLIHSARGIPFKLSLTATPAPNDTMEYASQAAFLERLRNEGEILWTWFARDKHGNWRIKPHGQRDFYRFMASWSVYMRDPAVYGFTPILDTLPAPIVREHEIPITSEQAKLRDEILVHTGRGLFDERLGVRERAKFAQLARGFLIRDGKPVDVDARKPVVVADLVAEHVAAGRPTLVWTNFDREAEILARLLDGYGGASLHGSTSDDERSRIIDDFRHGDLPLLISKAQLLGHGLNFQRCKAMVFSGLDDSFERFYQAVRRAYRLGQTDPVHVEIPFVPELEGLVLGNVQAKQERFFAEVDAQERHYLEATQEVS